MDKLVITNISFSTLIGVHPWEKICPQKIHLDLVFKIDVAKIAQTDDLQHALDYDKVVMHIEQFVTEYHFQLIETLAEQIAMTLLEHFAINWVQLTLHKPGALKQAKDVSITIERSKSE